MEDRPAPPDRHNGAMAASPDHPLVALARRYFVTFYALADEEDAALMDSLVLTRAVQRRLESVLGAN